jgi:hypothetical protein
LMQKKSDNTQITGKRKPPRTAWKPGQSGNPKGAPKRGGSMAEAYAWAMALRPDEVVEILTLNGSNDLARQFKQMPQGIQLKLLVALRIVAAVMFEPSPGLINHMADRVDGPVKQEEEHSGKVEIVVTYSDRDNIAAPAPGASDDQGTG